jgi:nucleotide-binding universal stress UspA family protein
MAMSVRYQSRIGGHHPGARQPSPASEEVTGHEHLPHHDPSGDGRLHGSRGRCRYASELAKRTGSELHVLYVLPLPIDTQDPSSFEPEVHRLMEERTRATLEELVVGIESSGGEVAGSHLGIGRPDAEIVERAEGVGAGLIVIGSRGYGPIRQAFIGSVSDSVVSHAHCPVMVVRKEKER